LEDPVITRNTGQHRTQGHKAVFPVRFEYAGFEVLTAVVMKGSIFWDKTPRSSLKFNGSFGGTYYLYVSPKSRLTFKVLQGVILQKIESCIRTHRSL
jgi:hypothetical protein